MAQASRPDPQRPPLHVVRGGHADTAPAQPKLKLPERPQLAPDVELAGQMEESAYEDPPWLLERKESGYVQVTELLYRIAERCDGKHTYEQIAQEVSEATEREVSAENVAQLIARELLVKGLVADAEGRVVKPPAAARSLLAIRQRMKLLGPGLIHPPTDVLKALFWPPVLLVVIGVAALAEWWLFAVHGVGGGLHEALYNPALILPLIAFIVVSAAFHEFGHASALRYGGGKVRAMGAGFYLIYPVLYTDVSDNYRLKRWARVRTDLGGFYFNLIFALVLMGAYAVTRFEFLLVVVALINLDILKQLLPFIRLDGYWTLVDITGMPDFFSRIGGFVKSMIPWRERKENEARTPRMKWWARIVFTLYILITIPFLLFSGFLLFRSVPRVLATVLDSGGKVLGRAAEAQAAGDWLAAAGLMGQLLLLALPGLGITYAAFNLLRGGFRFIVKWAAGSLPKAIAGSVLAGGVAAGVVFLWLPALPVVGTPGPLYRASAFTPIQPDERFTLRDAVRGEAISSEGTRLELGGSGAQQTASAGRATPGSQQTPGATPQSTAPAVAPLGPTATTRPAVAPNTVPPTAARPAATTVPQGASATTAPAAAASATAVPGQGAVAPNPTTAGAASAGTALASPTTRLPTATSTPVGLR